VIVVDAAPEAVAHASREHGEVVEEALPTLLERYRFRAARRIAGKAAP
jgi:hypothetical protein